MEKIYSDIAKNKFYSDCFNNLNRFLLCLIIIAFCSFSASAQKPDDAIDGDEIIVQLDFRRLGSIEIPAFYDNKDLYLSVTGVFDFLKIRNLPSISFDSIKGFYINEQDTFSINNSKKSISFKGREYDLSSKGLILKESALYMNLKYFDSVFSLNNTFSFRRLIVNMKSDVELPVIREMRQALMRKNISRLNGEIKADTVLKREYPLFHLGMADWAMMASRQSGSADQVRLNSSLGAMVAGGEATASINYNYGQALTEQNQFYQWRFVNNDFAPLRQVLIGKMYAQSTASVFAPMMGFQISSASTTTRQSFGTFTLTNTTQPGWIVELYVNDVLVDYKKADASGLFTFDVPLVYGLTIVKLKFYGPYGEERMSQQFINIPFSLLPRHQFEYQASAGLVEDGLNSRFSRLKLSYGLTKTITIGAGYEYLTSVASGNLMPFLTTSIRLGPQLLFSGEYTHSVRTKGILSYRLPSGIQFDEDFTEFVPGQKAIFFNYLQESKTLITMPLHPFGLSLFSRLTIDHIVAPKSTYSNAEWALAGFYKSVGVNFTTFVSYMHSTLPYMYSMLSLSAPLPKQILFTSQLQYDFKNNDLMSVKLTFEKHLKGSGFMNLALQDYFNSGNVSAALGARFELRYARVSGSVLQGNNNNYAQVMAASGSLISDARSGYFAASSRTSVGKAAVVIIPFLDLNGNGIRDKGEPIASGLIVRLNGGRIEYDDKDTTIRIFDLQPFTKYLIELDRNSFDNIAWQLKNKSLIVTTNPDMFTKIEIPVQVAQEIEGVVKVTSADGMQHKGQGQIAICIYNDTVLVARTTSESDGFFSYLGLSAGKFTVAPDTVQMRKLNMKCTPAFLPVSFEVSRDGSVVDGLSFSLQSLDEDTTQKAVPVHHNDTIATATVAVSKTIESGKASVAKSKEVKAVKDSIKTVKKLAATKSVKDNKPAIAKADSLHAAGSTQEVLVAQVKKVNGGKNTEDKKAAVPALDTNKYQVQKVAVHMKENNKAVAQNGTDHITDTSKQHMQKVSIDTKKNNIVAPKGYTQRADSDKIQINQASKVAVLSSKPVVVNKSIKAEEMLDREVKINSKELPDSFQYVILAKVVIDSCEAELVKLNLVRLFKMPVAIVPAGVDYIVELTGFSQLKEASRQEKKLLRAGYRNTIILKRRK